MEQTKSRLNSESIPLQKENENYQYTLPFDIGTKDELVSGTIHVTEHALIICTARDETKKASFLLSEITEFDAEKQVGSANFNAVINGKRQLLVKCTAKQFEMFAELAKVLNYYLKTGEFTELDYNESICPKCKQPLFHQQQCSFCQPKGKILIRFMRMFKKFYPLMLLSVLTTLFTQSLWIILPYFQRLLIDDYIRPANANIFAYGGIVASMIAIHLIMTVTYRINARFTNKVSNGVGKELRSLVFTKIQSLSMSSISKKTAGELINRVNSDTARIQDFISDFGPEMILRIVTFCVLIVILIMTNWQLALMVLLPVPVVFFVVSRIQRKIEILYMNFWRRGAKANSILHDILSGIRIVKIFGTEKREVEKYRSVSMDYTQAQQRAELYWSYRMPFIDFFITIGQYFLLYYGGNLVLNQQMQVGELMQLASYVAMIYIPLRWMMQIRRNISNVGVSASKILEIMDEDENRVDIENTQDIAITGEMEFKNVAFGYKKYESVLHNVSFHVSPGEMIGIVGHSGAGKSTLINLILCLYDATEGEVLIDGENINQISQTALRKKMGVVLQETFLFYGSVFENIRYSKPDATFEQVMEAAKIANAHSFITNLPDGYNTRVGEKGYNLSGGERQRIAIARAILHDPKILILDEATASLDTKTEKDIQDALDRLMYGRTTFAIAHRLSTLRQADRLLVLDKGTVAEIGTHMELMRNKSVYYNLVMAQRQTAKINS